MTPTRPGPRELAFVLLLTACYLALCLRGLGTIPPVYEDEPWQAASAWKLARDGTFGNDLFAGLDGMERRCYTYPPVHPLLLAATFRLAGVGLVQARLETVAMGLVALVSTWALGRRLAGPWVGGLAPLLLLAVRTSFVDRYQPTGILLLDDVRVARYDAVVPAFALLCLFVASRAAQRNRPGLWAVSGLAAALAALTHLYGLFLLVPLLAFALWERAGARAIAAIGGGFLVPWLAYAAYVATDVGAWIAQTRGYAPRFQLLDPAWYLDNLARERWRYAQGFGDTGTSWLLRPGFWTAAIGVPFALVALLRLARQAQAGEPADGAAVPARHAARLLVLPILTLPPLYALFLWLKLPGYRLMIQPFCALALAWGLVRLWRTAGRSTRARLATRAALVSLGLLVATEATAQIVGRERQARATTPWPELSSRLRRALPAEGRLLALHHYWFGFEARDVRSWAVPLLQATGADGRASASGLEERLDDLAPAAVLVDRKMRELFENQPDVERSVRTWLRSRSFVALPPVDDATYGRIEIFVAPSEPER